MSAEVVLACVPASFMLWGWPSGTGTDPVAEIRRLTGKTQEKGLTLIPLSLYFKKGRVKCEMALARGKKLYDKRHSDADRDAKKKMAQAMKGGIRRHGEDA